MDKELVESIMELRQKKEIIRSVHDVREMANMTEEHFNKIKPYLSVKN
jgi:hypothetical protein